MLSLIASFSTGKSLHIFSLTVVSIPFSLFFLYGILGFFLSLAYVSLLALSYFLASLPSLSPKVSVKFFPSNMLVPSGSEPWAVSLTVMFWRPPGAWAW